jgi:hypothetical protein
MKNEGFMYLDIDNPLVAWNVYRGVLISQALVQQGLKDSPVTALSMTAAKMFMDRDWQRLDFESALEDVRKIEYPDLPSRLNCLFVFDEPESALTAATDEGWGGHIAHENLTDVGISAAPNFARVDANWILGCFKCGTAMRPHGLRGCVRTGPACPIPIQRNQSGKSCSMALSQFGAPRCESGRTRRQSITHRRPWHC